MSGTRPQTSRRESSARRSAGPSGPPLVVGWREWVHLPSLGIKFVKAKVDTGARTSALHASHLHYLSIDGVDYVRFEVHPKQRSQRGACCSQAKLLEKRLIRSSNGKQELRPVILATVDIGGNSWEIELTLTNRDVMGFRMLLGRQAVRRHALVDPGRAFVTRKVKRTTRRSSEKA